MNAIEIKNLTKVYGQKRACDGISLNIKENEIFALLGVNGAGKSTTIKMLTGLIKPTDGDATINGLSIKKDMSKIKEIINVSPQETAVAEKLTVLENLDFIAGVYGIEGNEKVDEIVKLFNLEEVLDQKAGKLSGGWKRSLSIAMALVNEPKVLFLDEPTLGLDVIARRNLWSIIEELKNKMTIVFTTHYMEEAEALSEYVAIMKNGKIIEQGTCQDIVKKAKAKNFEDAFIKIEGGETA